MVQQSVSVMIFFFLQCSELSHDVIWFYRDDENMTIMPSSKAYSEFKWDSGEGSSVAYKCISIKMPCAFNED